MKIEEILCTGCSACSQKCPNTCIQMDMDVEGFYMPVINKEKCVQCGLCEQVCPVINAKMRVEMNMSAYGCKLKNEENLWNSTSGGAFYALGESTLKKNGIVYGAAYSVDVDVEHVGVTDVEGLKRLRKSKYVQSNIKNTYREAEEQLRSGRIVLYSGTPCQIAGLSAYLGREYTNLLKVEVFCHSISSPGVWRIYLQQREAESASKAVFADFRAKKVESQSGNSQKFGVAKSGWKNPYFQLLFQNGEYYCEKMESNLFLKGFSNGLSTRLSCHNCKFKLLMNASDTDISLGDFWGIETVNPDFFDERGVSVMICHTDKARLCLEELKADMIMQEFALEDVFPGNKELCIPAPEHKNRHLFFAEFANGNKNVDHLLQKYLGFFAAVPSVKLRIGLLGSHNTRRAINTICAGSKCDLTYQFCNTSLISMFAEKCSLPTDINLPSNPFRAEMLIADFEKAYKKDISHYLQETDILCIDFLEERFDMIDWENSFVTMSDAYQDAMIKSDHVVSRMSEDCMKQWQTACVQLIETLKSSYSMDKVILVKQFLCEEHGNSEKKHKFKDLENIKAINQILEEYYTFFIRKSKIKNIVEISNSELMFSDENHRHGCVPCHTNMIHNEQLAEYLYKVIMCILERSI